ILFQNRASYAGFISDVGIFGRESYNFFPTDGRTYSHYVEQNPLDPAGFASGGWNPRYANLRNIKNFLNAVDAATALAPASQEAARGFAQTMEALELSYITAQRHDYGAVAEVRHGHHGSPAPRRLPRLLHGVGGRIERPQPGPGPQLVRAPIDSDGCARRHPGATGRARAGEDPYAGRATVFGRRGERMHDPRLPDLRDNHLAGSNLPE